MYISAIPLYFYRQNSCGHSFSGVCVFFFVFFFLFRISCFMCWPCTCVCTASIQPTTPGLSWLRLHKTERQSEWLFLFSTFTSINLFIHSTSYLPSLLPPPLTLPLPHINMQSKHHFVLFLNATISSCPPPNSFSSTQRGAKNRKETMRGFHRYQ